MYTKLIRDVKMAHTTEQTNILETNAIDLTDTQALGKIKQKSAKLALEEAQNLKGENLLLLDVKKLSALSDYVLIVTGNSSTHCRAIAENIRVQAKKNKLTILGFESDPQSEWILLDLSDTIVHVMQEEKRQYYALEKLWQIALEKASENR